jgi:hypothetical protein
MLASKDTFFAYYGRFSDLVRKREAELGAKPNSTEVAAVLARFCDEVPGARATFNVYNVCEVEDGTRVVALAEGRQPSFYAAVMRWGNKLAN